MPLDQKAIDELKKIILKRLVRNSPTRRLGKIT
jgi:hypothetical protein